MVTGWQGEGESGASRPGRIAQAATHGADGGIRRLLRAGQSGLSVAYDTGTGEFAQTVRRSGGPGVTTRREGTSLRYAAVAALGLGRLDVADQRYALAGRTAAELAASVGARALEQSDPGAVALALWAAAEGPGPGDAALLSRLGAVLASGQPIATVDLAWMLTAAVSAGSPGHSVAHEAASRLLCAQGAAGIFPHMSPPDAQNRWRRHVGSFADQIYPVQALARLFEATGDLALLDAAEATARRLCELQGPDGQWWWHYDARTGEVVERYPVYSVHQHSMAPMALFDLADAGGTERTKEIVAGLRWLGIHPEVDEELVVDHPGIIWRKVGRREPAKAARKLSAVTTSIRPGLHVPGLDKLFPADRVDHECRPYELGWLLYAWLPTREVARHD